jgi:hypothetical protein
MFTAYTTLKVLSLCSLGGYSLSLMKQSLPSVLKLTRNNTEWFSSFINRNEYSETGGPVV